jgi:hypothetical protein
MAARVGIRIDTDHLDTELLAAFVIMIVLATLAINITALHYVDIVLWPRFVVPGLLLTGLAGVMFRLGHLRVIGWIGIALYLLITMGLAFPSDEYIYGLDEPILKGVEWRILGFWAAYWSIGYGLWSCLAKLGAQARWDDPSPASAP